jgi:D-sedoheptulose 7-phosphate isomerase
MGSVHKQTADKQSENALEATNFLYPFIDSSEKDVDGLLDELVKSVRAKASESKQVRRDAVRSAEAQLASIACEMVMRFAQGAALFLFGNGGSASDAIVATSLFVPIVRKIAFIHASGGSARVSCLSGDSAVVSALGNDIGMDHIFARQIMACAKPSDIAMGFSTSGNSKNVIRAFEEAKKKGMLTIGLAGYEGGEMSRCGWLDHCLVVRSQSVHRIQEGQAALVLALSNRLGVELHE